MTIAGDNENIPSWVAHWPHCCDFRGDTCDDLRWSAMLLEAQNRRKMAHFIGACGRALTQSTTEQCRFLKIAAVWSVSH